MILNSTPWAKIRLRSTGGQEQTVFADAGYQGIEKRPDAKPEVLWHVAMRPRQAKGAG